MCEKSVLHPDPDPGRPKNCPSKNKKQCLNKNSCPKELDVLSGGLKASFGVWKFFVWEEINIVEPKNTYFSTITFLIFCLLV
jgi:hypothetical protein